MSTLQFAHLPFKGRERIEYWLKILEPVFDRPEKERIAFIAEHAIAQGIAKSTLLRKYYALKDKGRLALVDERLTLFAHLKTRRQGEGKR